MGTGEFNAGGNPAMDWHPIQGGVEIFLVASCHGNRDKLRTDGPLGLYADFIFKTFLYEVNFVQMYVAIYMYINYISSDVINWTNKQSSYILLLNN